MPAECVAVAVVLRPQVLGAVLADDLDAGLRERGEVVERDVLRRGNDGDPWPDLLPDSLVALAALSR